MQTSISPGTVQPATAGRRPQLQRKERDISDVASGRFRGHASLAWRKERDVSDVASGGGAFSRVVRDGCTRIDLVSFCRSGRDFAPDDNFSVCFWLTGEVSGRRWFSNPAVLFFQHPSDANLAHRNILTTCNLAQRRQFNLQRSGGHYQKRVNFDFKGAQRVGRAKQSAFIFCGSSCRFGAVLHLTGPSRLAAV